MATRDAAGWFSEHVDHGVVSATPWVWPAAETLHFIGLCLVFGVLLAVNLRLLGVMKALPFAAVHRLMPWAVLGFGVNLLTGMLFFIAAAGPVHGEHPVLLEGPVPDDRGRRLLYLTVRGDAWALESGEDCRLADKVIAASAIGAVGGRDLLWPDAAVSRQRLLIRAGRRAQGPGLTPGSSAARRWRSR